MRYRGVYERRGLTFIDVIISVAILVLLFGGIYMIYFSILDVVNGLDLRSAATSALNKQLEMIRNLPYDRVGVVNGVPSGVMPAEQTIVVGDVSFLVKTLVRNIDDPFDGTLGGSPNDTAPSDYKLVQLEASCPACQRFVPLLLTATVAPKSLESASNNGSLFINVIDASGVPVSQADVKVVNTAVSPAIDLTDATNVGGVLQLVGVPTSTQSYQISVSKSGYSAERTYAIGSSTNPNPLKPHATVAAQTVTDITFSIDKLSNLNVSTLSPICAPVGNRIFSLTGAKLLGTNPDVLKFSTSSTTNAQGVKIFSGLEWDNYTLTLSGTTYDLLGTIPLSPLIVNPSSTLDFKFIVQSADPSSLLVTVVNSTNNLPVAGATVEITKSGFSETLLTGQSHLDFTDWSGGGYSDQSGGVETENPAGNLKLALNPSSTYTTMVTEWLESNTIDFGSASTTFYSISWNPDSQPPLTGSESLKFQIAANNDQATWNYIGPDGTATSFYTQSSTTLNSVHNNNRYMRYKVFLRTEDEDITPELEDVTIGFTGPCVPGGQVLFHGLSAGTYSLRVSAAGFTEATSSVAVGSGWQATEVQISP